jgi:hypothetical protein
MSSLAEWRNDVEGKKKTGTRHLIYCLICIFIDDGIRTETHGRRQRAEKFMYANIIDSLNYLLIRLQPVTVLFAPRLFSAIAQQDFPALALISHVYMRPLLSAPADGWQETCNLLCS